jgi:hypothetical protein
MPKIRRKTRWSLKEERRLLQFASGSGSLKSLAVELQRPIDSILNKAATMNLPLRAGQKVEPKGK